LLGLSAHDPRSITSTVHSRDIERSAVGGSDSRNDGGGGGGAGGCAIHGRLRPHASIALASARRGMPAASMNARKP
jgi:hypothetical protein